ncbi:interferon lambda receptor 1 isoform X2 [Pelodiscus sinensis]|uniref:interferon lambda receptor 1 isoform X2 n=1 Tax=Pelodiscus sinensis TaxID=13735 RepID=UPI003F6C72F4
MESGSGSFSMSAGSRAVLVALCSFQQLLGSVALGQPGVPLPPPRNVKLLSKDFGVAVTWLPGEGSPPDVLYSVRYQTLYHQSNWKQVRHCKNISHVTCNLTCGPDPYNKFSTRVKALAAGRQSPWVESNSLEYHLDVHLAPPALAVSVAETTINVSATFPLASCVKSVFIGLKYDLDFWKAGTGDKVPFHDRMKWENVTISTLALSGNYCLSARASYQAIQLKHSQFSRPLCMLLTPRAKGWEFLITMAVPLLILLFFCTVAASVLRLCKQAAKKAKRPQALDFSRFQAPGTVLEELIERDLFICVVQPASAGRWRSDASRTARNDTSLVARNNASPVARNDASPVARNDASPVARNDTSPVARNDTSLTASLLSLSEEEDDDSGGFRPYTEMPLFLRRAPNCSGASMSQEGSHSGSELSGSHLAGGPVPDLAGLGFSRLVWRGGPAEEDASGFPDSEKSSSFSESSSVGEFSLSEAPCPVTCGGEWQGWEADTGQEDPFLQVSVLAEGLKGGSPAEEWGVPRRGPRKTDPQRHLHPDPSVCVARGVSEAADGFPLEEQLVRFQTVKLALDEGVASDSESLAGGAERDPPPLSAALSETGGAEAWGKGGGLWPARDPAWQCRGYQHMRYMPRT